MVSVLAMPQTRPLSYEEFDALREQAAGNGHRYELVDGSLVVTPGPGFEHQSVVGLLFLRLCAMCPPGLKVLLAPYDVRLALDTVMQPDLLVARRADFTRRELPVAPLLAVEVLSPSTRHIDLGLKRARFEAAGVASYWVVDPLALRVRAYDLVDGAYVEVADATGQDTFSVTHPFPVTLRPADLED